MAVRKPRSAEPCAKRNDGHDNEERAQRELRNEHRFARCERTATILVTLSNSHYHDGSAGASPASPSRRLLQLQLCLQLPDPVPHAVVAGMDFQSVAEAVEA